VRAISLFIIGIISTAKPPTRLRTAKNRNIPLNNSTGWAGLESFSLVRSLRLSTPSSNT